MEPLINYRIEKICNGENFYFGKDIFLTNIKMHLEVRDVGNYNCHAIIRREEKVQIQVIIVKLMKLT